jgi:uncharacterized protein VirK/YbjX
MTESGHLIQGFLARGFARSRSVFTRYWLDAAALHWAYGAFRGTKPSGFHQLRFAVRCAWRFGASARWFVHLRDSLYLQRTHWAADVLQLPHRPYFDRRLRALEAVSLLISHERLVTELFDQALLKRLESGQTCPISEIVGKSGEVHTLALSQEGRFLKEGLLSLSLIASGEIVISLAVTFGERSCGHSALIGGLQACANQPTERLRELTRELHGIQPRLLLLHALRAMCHELNVPRIEAVSAGNHVFRSTRYRWKKTVHLAYETLWEMVGGTKRSDGNYDIAVAVPRKPLCSYPSKKRSEHKRRFDLIDGMEVQIGLAVRGRNSIHPITAAA